MTQPATTQEDTTTEPLWMRSGPRGDELVRWEDLTEAERLSAIARHNKLYRVES
jgi:hypothetical protein